mgnify:CR=1 FL=1
MLHMQWIQEDRPITTPLPQCLGLIFSLRNCRATNCCIVQGLKLKIRSKMIHKLLYCSRILEVCPNTQQLSSLTTHMPIHSIYIHPMWMCNAEWDGVEKDRPMMLDRFLGWATRISTYQVATTTSVTKITWWLDGIRPTTMELFLRLGKYDWIVLGPWWWNCPLSWASNTSLVPSELTGEVSLGGH